MYITNINNFRKITKNVQFYKILSANEIIDPSKEDGRFYTINNVFKTLSKYNNNDKLFIVEINISKMTHNIAIMNNFFYTEELYCKNIKSLGDFLNMNFYDLLLTTLLLPTKNNIKNILNVCENVK